VYWVFVVYCVFVVLFSDLYCVVVVVVVVVDVVSVIFGAGDREQEREKNDYFIR
jgi:hypothetical protein